MTHFIKIPFIILGNDVVAALSIGLIRDFRNISFNLWQEPGIAESVISKILGYFPDKSKHGAYDEADELWCWALLKTLRADMDAEKLYPPGRIFWINARTEYMSISKVNLSNDVFSSDESPSDASPSSSSGSSSPNPNIMTMHLVQDVERAFSEFTISSTMLSDHTPNTYETALRHLVVAMQK